MKTSKTQRNQKGQALVGGACGIVMISLVFVLVTALGLNAFTFGTKRAKLLVAAEETAAKVNRNIYWNGALRPLFQRNNTDRITTEATAYAKAICRELGLDPDKVTVAIDSYGENGLSQVTLSLSQQEIPAALQGLAPRLLDMQATAISSEGSEPPPAFIRLGYNLIHDDKVNTANTTTVTQVCLLPAYGFETDLETGTGTPGLGGTDNNDDVVANQPDDRWCAWNALNVNWKTEQKDIARILANAPRKKNYDGTGYVPLFGTE